MKSKIITEEIIIMFELSDDEAEILSKRIPKRDVIKELNRCSLLIMQEHYDAFHFGRNDFSLTALVYVDELKERTEEIKEFLNHFIYYISLFGYIPELCQGDPVKIKREGRDLQINDYKHYYGESHGYKFRIKKYMI